MKYLQCQKCKIEMRTVGELGDDAELKPDIPYTDPMQAGWHKHQECGVRMRQLTAEQYENEILLNESGARD